MTLYLASSLEGSIDALIRECSLDPKTTHVAYIPTAEHCFPHPRQVTERGSYQSLVSRGFAVTPLDLDTDSPQDIETKVSHAQMIVGAGGNTYYLLYHMRRSGFDSLLRRYLERGGIYVGSSAGSCVCTPDIAYIGDQDDPQLAPNLTDTRGLDLVDFTLYPHCIEDYAQDAYTPSYLRSALTREHPKIFLRDHQAVLVRDAWYRIVS